MGVAPADANISKTGWTAGVGGEAALTHRITARLEYRYSDFGTTRFIWPDAAGSYEQHPRFQSVRGGVSFNSRRVASRRLGAPYSQRGNPLLPGRRC